MPHGINRGLHPAIGLHSEGEEVRINLDAEWEHPFVTLMAIDSCEEDWARLHDVRVNGQVSGLLYSVCVCVCVCLAEWNKPLAQIILNCEVKI